MIPPTGKHKTKQNGRYMWLNERVYLLSDKFFRDHLLCVLNMAFDCLHVKKINGATNGLIGSSWILSRAMRGALNRALRRCSILSKTLRDYANCKDTSAGTGKLCILGHLGLVFIWSCFVFCLLFLLFYVSLRNLCSGTCRKIQL